MTRLQRVLLSYYVANGAAAALGLLLISAAVQGALGAAAAGAPSIGVIVCIPPDQAAPVKGKVWNLLPAALLGLPLFYAVQALRHDAVGLGLVLVPATFLAFLAGAWGKRGLPIAMSVMFAMVFSMAFPDHSGAGAATSALHFGLGAGLYLLYAPLANRVLNGRYRTQMLADTLLALAQLMRSQAERFMQSAQSDKRETTVRMGALLREQALLTDQLQGTRDLVLESPNTPQRQRLAALLLLVLDMRDHLTACELDLDALNAATGSFHALQGLRDVMLAMATDMEGLADALLSHGDAPVVPDRRPQLAHLSWDTDAAGAAPAQALLARALASRVGNLSDDAVRASAIARQTAVPDVALIRLNWHMFVSATAWSWRPFVAALHWKAPPLRHALRAALAIGFAYVLGLLLPWGTHDYWILLTIVVVLRGSLAQTLERRNSRVLGTLVGCVLAGAVLSLHAPVWALLLVVTLAQAVAHAMALQRYLITAIAATVLGLVQAHLIAAGQGPLVNEFERIADTLLGVSIAWAFSYVLPSWERNQVSTLVTRALHAQARYAGSSLSLGHVQHMEYAPELAWRLARRESYETLSALVQATQRALAEPRAVQPPLEPLGRILALSYQLLAQLTAIKTMLLARRERLQLDQIAQPLAHTASVLELALRGTLPATATAIPALQAAASPDMPPALLTDPFEGSLTPWLLRRLTLATDLAHKLAYEQAALRSAQTQH
jgi:uncharacterized membrane protein YccC